MATKKTNANTANTTKQAATPETEGTAAVQTTPSTKVSPSEAVVALHDHERHEQAMQLHARIKATAELAATALLQFCKELKEMHDTGLYTEFGRETFEEYTERELGIKQRQAYYYIRTLDNLGPDFVEQNAGLGITKLRLLADVAPLDRDDFLKENNLGNMSTAEIAAAVKKAKGLGEQLDNMGVDIMAFFKGLWAKIVGVFQGVGQWFTARFTEAYNGIVSIFTGIGEWFAARWQDIQNALASVGTWFLIMFQTAYTNVTQAFMNIGQWFSDRWVDIQTALSTVATWFLTMFQTAYANVRQAFMSIGQWFAARWQDVKNALATVATWFMTMFQNAYNNVVQAFQSIGSWFSARWSDIQNAFASTVSFFSNTFTNAWNAIVNAFSGVGSFFGSLWNDIVSRFTDIGVRIGEAVGGAFKGIVNSVIGTAENIINGFFSMINGAIDVINSIPGVGIGHINYLSFPRLAKGGVLHEGQAIMAEAGPEMITVSNGRAIVTPLTRGAKNTAVEAVGDTAVSGGVRYEPHFHSPKAIDPYEAYRLSKRETRNLVRKLNKGRT